MQYYLMHYEPNYSLNEPFLKKYYCYAHLVGCYVDALLDGHKPRVGGGHKAGLGQGVLQGEQLVLGKNIF